MGQTYATNNFCRFVETGKNIPTFAGMLGTAKISKRTPCTVTCNKCGEKIAYISSNDDRHTRQTTLEKAIHQHVCKKLDIKFN